MAVVELPTVRELEFKRFDGPDHFRVSWVHRTRLEDPLGVRTFMDRAAELVVKVRASCVVFWPAHLGDLGSRAGNKEHHSSDGWAVPRGGIRFAVPNPELVALAKGCCDTGQPEPLIDWLLERDSHPVLRAIVADFQTEFGGG